MADISQVNFPDDVNNPYGIKASSITDDLKATLVNLMYPVGSIYMSVSSTNPGTTFGVGTWEAWGSGRVPVGVDSNDTSFDTVEETGGNKSNSYTPAGTNTGCAVTKHTYTPRGINTGCKVIAHTYTPAGTIGDTTLTAAQSGVPKHTHALSKVTLYKSTLNNVKYGMTSGGFFEGDVIVGQATGMLTTNAFSDGTAGNNTAKNASAAHTHDWTGTQATLSHSVTQPTFTGTEASLTHTVTQPTFTGTAHNISTIQPYITCYMWKRTA